MILKNRFHYKGQTKSSSLVRMTPLLVVISLSELVVKGPVRMSISVQDGGLYFCFNNTVASGRLVICKN